MIQFFAQRLVALHSIIAYLLVGGVGHLVQIRNVRLQLRFTVADGRCDQMGGQGLQLIQFGRLFEGHFTWATAPLILGFVAYLPLYLNRSFSHESLAYQLPIITSRIMTLSSVTIIITALISIISLPPRPPRYRRSRGILMVLQWLLLPVTSIGFGAFAAINAQTRLMFGRYLEFYVTEKSTRK